MSKGYVKGGTPIGSDSLCQTCSYAHIMIGYRESEMITICNDVSPSIVVPFKVYECTAYYDKNRPNYQQMEKLAIHVSADRTKPVGFKSGTGFGVGTVTYIDDEASDCVKDEED